MEWWDIVGGGVKKGKWCAVYVQCRDMRDGNTDAEDARCGESLIYIRGSVRCVEEAI